MSAVFAMWILLKAPPNPTLRWGYEVVAVLGRVGGEYDVGR
jgi:hypothetical protein